MEEGSNPVPRSSESSSYPGVYGFGFFLCGAWSGGGQLAVKQDGL